MAFLIYTVSFKIIHFFFSKWRLPRWLRSLSFWFLGDREKNLEWVGGLGLRRIHLKLNCIAEVKCHADNFELTYSILKDAKMFDEII